MSLLRGGVVLKSYLEKWRALLVMLSFRLGFGVIVEEFILVSVDVYICSF